MLKTLWETACTADRAFQAALVEEHGKEAGDIRYQNAQHSPRVAALREAYKTAIEEWRNAYQKESKNA